MVYTYTPTYYSTIQDSFTSLCKTILPFPFKKRRGLPASERKLSKQQSDNLKWQQDSFHQILNLMGLHTEGILSEIEVMDFRTHLLDTLIVAPVDREQPVILRDKLLFLKELFYAKCISEDEYHASKRPLLQRLAVQGAEIDTKDIIISKQKEVNSEEEWSVIDLRDEKTLLNKETPNSKNKTKHAMKQIKGAASVLGLYKHVKSKNEKMENVDQNMVCTASATPNKLRSSQENPFWNTHMNAKESETPSILMSESVPLGSIEENGGESIDKAKKKLVNTEEAKSSKKQWGFDGIKKWKRSNVEDETAPLPLSERSDNKQAFDESPCKLVSSPVGEGPDTKQMKKKFHSDGSSSDFFIDKVLGDKIKKELSRIQSELNTSNPNLQFSNDQIEAISTRLPVDKTDLKKFFPKSWCDRYGDVVLDVVKKEFKDHVGEIKNLRNTTRDGHNSATTRWTTFEDEENCHPNLFSTREDDSYPVKKQSNNPFHQDYTENINGNKLKNESAFFEYQNPFWSPRH